MSERDKADDRFFEEIPGQILIYEKKENSAVIWRCFSHEEKAVIPGRLEGLTVTGLAPYCFSAHMDPEQIAEGLRSGRLRMAGGAENQTDATERQAGSSQAGGAESQTGAGSGEPLPPGLWGGRLQSLSLPRTVVAAGRYCFYNCERLRELEFYGGLAEWGSGVFTGCHQIRRIRLHLEKDEKSRLKEVLDELPDELQVEYCVDGETGGRAMLVFPGFYEEGVENTPARILETHVHGSGILYRNCFRDRVFDFRQYDRMFPYSCAREDFEVIAALVTGRLWYPWRLSEEAQRQYEAFAAAEREQFAGWFFRKKDMRGIRWLTELTGRSDLCAGAEQGERERACAEFLDRMLELAAGSRFPEAVSYLMEQKRRRTEPRHTGKRRRLEL